MFDLIIFGSNINLIDIFVLLTFFITVLAFILWSDKALKDCNICQRVWKNVFHRQFFVCCEIKLPIFVCIEAITLMTANIISFCWS